MIKKRVKLIFQTLIILKYLFLFCVVFFVIPRIYKYLNSSKKTLYLCTLSDVISPDIIKGFEDKYNVRVVAKYCDIDTEFWAQLYVNRGQGYDLVTPTNFVANKLIEHSLVQPIDLNKVSNFSQLNHDFITECYDQNSLYSLPFAWTWFGLFYDKPYFKELNLVPTSLGYVFDPASLLKREQLGSYKVCLMDENPTDLIFLAGIFTNSDLKVAKGVEKSKTTLVKQRQFLHSYISSNMKYYVYNAVPIILTQFAPIKDLSLSDEKVRFVLPEEGTLLVPQNFCIPSRASNLDLAYKFIDYVLEKESSYQIFSSSGHFPTHLAALEEIKKEIIDQGVVWPDKNYFDNKIKVVDRSISSKKIDEIWREIKGA